MGRPLFKQPSKGVALERCRARADSTAKRNRWGQGRAGFTMIEMLVVIAIIVVLAALLLPVIATARGTARSAQCKSNLRQLWMGASQYSDLWNGVLPPFKWRDPGTEVVVRFGDDADAVVVEKPRWPTKIGRAHV